MTRFEHLKLAVGIGPKMVPVGPQSIERHQSLSLIDGIKSTRNKNLPVEYLNSRYVWFGEDNLYPQRLNDLYETVSLHAAIIDFKKLMIAGQGYEISQTSMTAMDKVTLAGIENSIMDDTTLQEFVNDITMDYLIHATVYIKLHWNADKTRLIGLERIEPSKIRVGYDLKTPEKPNKFFYCFDWRDTFRFPVREYHPKDPKSPHTTEIWRIMKRSPSCLFNTVPAYASAVTWLDLESRIPIFHLANIEQSVNPSKIINFYSKPANDEARREIVRNIDNSFAGEEKTGKIWVFFSDGRELAPDIKSIEPTNLDKQFKETAAEGRRNICHAHNINPVIMGLKEAGSMGNPQELMNAYEIFKTNIIEPARYDIEVIINKIIKWHGLGVNFKLKNVELFENIKNN